MSLYRKLVKKALTLSDFIGAVVGLLVSALAALIGIIAMDRIGSAAGLIVVVLLPCVTSLVCYAIVVDGFSVNRRKNNPAEKR